MTIPQTMQAHSADRFDRLLLAVLAGLAIMWVIGFARNVVAWSYCGQEIGPAVVESLMFDGPSAGECVLSKAGKELSDTFRY